jgi:hypothetical protein
MDEEIEKTPIAEEPEIVEEPIPAEVPGEDTAVEESPENTNAELIDIIKRVNPGLDLSSPELITSATLKTLKILVQIYDKVYDLALAAPETAALLNDWLETGELAKAIARNYDPDEILALVEEIKDESYEEDKKVYSDKIKVKRDRETLLTGNMAKSQMSAQEFVDEEGLNEADIEEFKPFVDQFFRDVEDKNLTAPNWKILWKAFKRDNDVAEAEDNGRVIGRNEKIVAEKKTRDDIKELLPEANAGASLPKRVDSKKSYASKFMDGVI